MRVNRHSILCLGKVERFLPLSSPLHHPICHFSLSLRLRFILPPLNTTNALICTTVTSLIDIEIAFVRMFFDLDKVLRASLHPSALAGWLFRRKGTASRRLITREPMAALGCCFPLDVCVGALPCYLISLSPVPSHHGHDIFLSQFSCVLRDRVSERFGYMSC
jgi:hypothetical protein